MSTNEAALLGLVVVAVVAVFAIFRFSKNLRITIKALGSFLTLNGSNDSPSSARTAKAGKSASAARGASAALSVVQPAQPQGIWISRRARNMLVPVLLVAIFIITPLWWWRQHSEAWKLVLADHISEAWVLWKQGPKEPVYYARSGETLHTLTRMLDRYADELGRDVHRTSEIWIVDHYWQYWTTDTFSDYIRANRRFIDSGGKIHRIFILSDQELQNPRVRAVLHNQCEKIGADVWRGDAATIRSTAEYQIVAKAFKELPHTEPGFQTFDVLQLDDVLYYSSDFSNDYRVLGGSTWFYGQTLDLKPLFSKSIAQPIDCSAWKAPQDNMSSRYSPRSASTGSTVAALRDGR
ncbi:MAG: hypothetical protein LAO78_08490 [Acidobacteriia bacterium]|nr:hypothetical protein [Terriglobia bacterium]